MQIRRFMTIYDALRITCCTTRVANTRRIVFRLFNPIEVAGATFSQLVDIDHAGIIRQ